MCVYVGQWQGSPTTTTMRQQGRRLQIEGSSEWAKAQQKRVNQQGDPRNQTTGINGVNRRGAVAGHYGRGAGQAGRQR